MSLITSGGIGARTSIPIIKRAIGLGGSNCQLATFQKLLGRGDTPERRCLIECLGASLRRKGTHSVAIRWRQTVAANHSGGCKAAGNGEKLLFSKGWRRGWDSNPR